MEIPPLNSRGPLLELAEQHLGRASAVLREVFGNRGLVQAIVLQAPQAEQLRAEPGRNPNQQAELQRVILQIENRNLEALSPKTLREGQVLSLQLDAQGRIQVRAVDGQPIARATEPPPDLIQRVIEQLRPQLARQEPPLALIRNLFALFNRQLAESGARGAAPPPANPAAAAAPTGQSPATPGTLPPTLIEPLLRTLASLHSTENLQQNLPQAIRDNGLQLEAKLARALLEAQRTIGEGRQASRGESGAPSPAPATTDRLLQQALATDLKANLLRLQEVLQQVLATGKAAPAAGTTPAQTEARLDQVLRQLSQAAARLATGTVPATGPGGSGTAGADTRQAPGAGMRTVSPLLQLLAFPTPVPSQGGGAFAASEPLDLALSTLLRQVAATIARMNLHQLQGVTQQQAGAADGAATNTWFSEIPLVHGQQIHLYQLRIDRDSEQDGQGGDDGASERIWSFTLSFDIEPMGPMYAQVRMRQQQVSAKFWAEEPATLAYVREELDGLKNKLSALGLQVTELEAYPGAPVQRQTRLTQQLVDIQT